MCGALCVRECVLCERSRVGPLPTQWALSLRLSAYAEVHPRLRLLGGVGCILVPAGRWLRARVRAGQETKGEASGMGAGHRNCHLGAIVWVLRCGSEAHRLDPLEQAAAAGRRWCRAACAMVRSAARRGRSRIFSRRVRGGDWGDVRHGAAPTHSASSARSHTAAHTIPVPLRGRGGRSGCGKDCRGRDCQTGRGWPG